MKIHLRKPSKERLDQWLQSASNDDLTYRDIGSTKNWDVDLFQSLPDFKVVDGDLTQYRRSSIGSGEADFEAAKEHLTRGVCFDLGWVQSHRLHDRPLNKDDSFCLMAQAFGLWTTNFCRVVYRSKDTFANRELLSIGIGTLPEHAAAGEERISVVWEKETDSVDLLIGSFSQPQRLLSKLFAIYLRRQQNRFAIDAANRMRAAIEQRLK